MQTTRIQLNSRDSNIDVYKTLPSAELNKRYVIRVEQLTIPAMSDGLIFNQELFTVERRCVLTTIHTVGYVVQPTVQLQVPATFIPQNVKTVSQLAYQMNAFFRQLFLRLLTAAQAFADGADYFDITEEFARQEDEDWYRLPAAIYEGAGAAIEGIYRSDGKIGFKFSVSGQKLFVLRMTDEGKRIFGWQHRYIAIDANGRFTPYVNDAGLVMSTLPDPNLTEAIVGVMANSIFNHGHYRHEIVVLTTLPLQQYVECDQNSAQFKSQLASYRYPNESIQTEYRGTLFKILKESRSNVYVFEHANRTHNEFLLTGTDLQNFHVRLVVRNYKWNETKQQFIIDEKPYPLPPDSLWTITFKVRPLT